MDKKPLRSLHLVAVFGSSVLLIPGILSCSMAPLLNDIAKFVDDGTATERIGTVTLDSGVATTLTENSWTGYSYTCKTGASSTAVTVVAKTNIDLQQLSYK